MCYIWFFNISICIIYIGVCIWVYFCLYRNIVLVIYGELGKKMWYVNDGKFFFRCWNN